MSPQETRTVLRAANQVATRMETEIKELKRQLARANRIIGWMCPYIGSMCPPPDGIAEWNNHCIDNVVPSPGKSTKGSPLNQGAYRRSGHGY